MRIFYPVVNTNTGAQVYIERLAAGMAERGHDVRVKVYPKWMELVPSLMALLAAHRSSKVDVIHANTWNGYAFKKDKTRLLCTEHHALSSTELSKSNLQKFYHSVFIRRFVAASYKSANHVVCVSKATENAIRNELPSVTPYSTVYNWLEPTFQPSDENHKNFTKRARLLYVGSLIHRKGADLLPALAERLKDYADIYYCSKSGNFSAAELPENLHALPAPLTTLQLIKEYQNADLLLVPSRQEGFGYSAVEAMACGTPAIAFDLDVFKEVFGPFASQLLCSRFDTNAMAKLIISLLSNRAKLDTLSDDCSRWARATYNKEIALDAYEKLYNELCAGG